MRDRILITLFKMQPHYNQSSGENATPSSDTSPSASFKEVTPPHASVIFLTSSLQVILEQLSTTLRESRKRCFHSKCHLTRFQEANQTKKKIKKPFFRNLWLIFIDVMLKQIQITTFSHYIKTEAEESF